MGALLPGFRRSTLGPSTVGSAGIDTMLAYLGTGVKVRIVAE
jgi:hypothetical protein